jgi:hypothetical protein
MIQRYYWAQDDTGLWHIPFTTKTACGIQCFRLYWAQSRTYIDDLADPTLCTGCASFEIVRLLGV